MKAILLTYDEQSGLAELVVKSYEALIGNDLPIEFLIPYQSADTYKHFKSNNVSYIQSASGIKESIKALLAGIDDDEWVLWCIDDRYPVKVDKTKFIAMVNNLSKGEVNANFNGFKLTKWVEPVSAESVEFSGAAFQQQEECGMTGFWHHQFVRARILRKVFVDCEEYQNDIRLLNNRLHKQHILDFLLHVHVPSTSIVWFKEPLKKGLLTINGIEDLKKFNCPVPDYDTIKHNIYFNPVDER